MAYGTVQNSIEEKWQIDGISLHTISYAFGVLVGHPEPEKSSVGIFEYILASMLKVYLDVFRKDRGGCQVWKCPKVSELGQRSTECKFLYIRQILAFVSISYPKLCFKVMQNLF